MPILYVQGSHHQQIDHVPRIIFVRDNNGPTAGKHGKKLRVWNVDDATISEMKVKWLVWSSLVYLAKRFDIQQLNSSKRDSFLTEILCNSRNSCKAG